MKRNPDASASSILSKKEALYRAEFLGALLLTLVFVLTVLSFFAFNAFSKPGELASKIFLDDSFMYLETAWQTAINHFVTFDSKHPTNGVQFLWFLIIFFAAIFSPTKIAFLYFVYGLIFALIGSIYLAIWRTGTLMSDTRRVFTMLMTLMWTFVVADRQNQMFSGMESALHMATLWFCLAAGMTALIQSNRDKRFPDKWFFIFTLGVVAVTWSRIDSALFSLSLYLYVSYNLYTQFAKYREIARRYVVSIFVALIGALIQIGFFYFSGRTFLPISGLVKVTAVGPEISAEWWVRIISIISPFAKLFEETNVFFLLLQTLVFSVLLGLVILRAIRSSLPLRYLYGFAGSLGGVIPVYAAIVGPFHEPEWRWYLSPVFLFYIIGISALFYESWGQVAARILSKRSVVILIGISISLTIVFVMFYSHRTISHFRVRVEVAQFLKRTTDPDVILAAFNAGQLAFFSDRHTINLDGLVNSRSYFEDVFNRPNYIVKYLRDNNVRYIVDYDFYWARDVMFDNTVQVYSFKIPGDPTRASILIRELKR